MQVDNRATIIGFDKNHLEKSFKEINGVSFAEFNSLNKQEMAKIEGIQGHTLTGYTKDKEISIWGKLMGYDPDFNTEQIDELKNFINESGGLAIEHLPLINKRGFSANKLNFAEDKPFSFDEFANKFNSTTASVVFTNTKSIQLLDSNLSIDEFKKEWAKNTLNERFGLILSDEDATNAINILNEFLTKKEESNKTTPTNNFKAIQAVSESKTYKDESINELKKFYEFIKKEFENGKNTFEILKFVAENRIDKKI